MADIRVRGPGLRGRAGGPRRQLRQPRRGGRLVLLSTTRGEKVVDLWGGVADPPPAALGGGACQLVFSTTRGIVAICANQLIRQGRLDPDARVAEYWPGIRAQAGREDVLVRWLLSHKARAPGDRRHPLHQGRPWRGTRSWRGPRRAGPDLGTGRKHSCHAATFRMARGELIRRVDGRSVGAYVAEGRRAARRRPVGPGVPETASARSPRSLPIDLPDSENVRMVIEQVLGPDNITGKALRTPCPRSCSAAPRAPST